VVESLKNSLSTPSGKVYIGQTCKNPNIRWLNGSGYKWCTRFRNSILKYGWDNIKHEILFENLNKISADCIEIDLIYYYKKLGISLNITNGGEGALGRIPSEETRRKMSIAATGRHLSEEAKKKVSLNNGRGMLGKHPSKETLKKMSDSHKGKKPSKETLIKRALAMKDKNNKPVAVYNIDGTIFKTFISSARCAEFFNVIPATINNVLRGRSKTLKRKYLIK
jgi:group I intron endonuclease